MSVTTATLQSANEALTLYVDALKGATTTDETRGAMEAARAAGVPDGFLWLLLARDGRHMDRALVDGLLTHVPRRHWVEIGANEHLNGDAARYLGERVMKGTRREVEVGMTTQSVVLAALARRGALSLDTPVGRALRRMITRSGGQGRGSNIRQEFLRIVLGMPTLTEADLLWAVPFAQDFPVLGVLVAHASATPAVWTAALDGATELDDTTVEAIASVPAARSDEAVRARLREIGEGDHPVALAYLAIDLAGDDFVEGFAELADADADVAGKALLLYPDTNLALLDATALMPVLSRGDTTSKLRAIQVIRYGTVLDQDDDG